MLLPQMRGPEVTPFPSGLSLYPHKTKNSVQMAFRKPCLDCGALSYGSRCETHAKRLEQLKDIRRAEKKKTLYNSEYRRQAAIVRATAITCHLCGDGARLDDPWQADHLDAGNPMSPLAAAHRSCNAKRGDKPLS